MVDVFISWSGETGHRIALLLREWLPDVIHEVRPWVSSEDIPKGRRWSQEISARLSETSQGVVCVTRDSQHEPWLNFEAGALAKSPDDANVRTLLIDLAPSDVSGPLGDFQHTLLRDRDDMLKFVESVNAACATPLDADRLRRSFDRLWPGFDDQVVAAVAATPPAEAARGLPEIVSEILERVRALERHGGWQPAAEAISPLHRARRIREARARIADVVGENLVGCGGSRESGAIYVTCREAPEDVDAYVASITAAGLGPFTGPVLVKFEDRPDQWFRALP